MSNFMFALKNKLNCKDSDIYDAIELVSVLSPNQAINYNISYNEHIVPDIFIEKMSTPSLDEVLWCTF